MLVMRAPNHVIHRMLSPSTKEKKRQSVGRQMPRIGQACLFRRTQSSPRSCDDSTVSLFSATASSSLDRSHSCVSVHAPTRETSLVSLLPVRSPRFGVTTTLQLTDRPALPRMLREGQPTALSVNKKKSPKRSRRRENSRLCFDDMRPKRFARSSPARRGSDEIQK